MKNIIKVLLVSMMTSVLFGCEKQEKEILNQNLEITLGKPIVNGINVRIRVDHNGSATDPWYGFYTTDLESDETALIATEVERIKASGEIKVNVGSPLVINLKKLQEDTEYKYIAFGLSEAGTYYGIPASVTFRTQNDLDAVHECTYWKITYNGRKEIKDEASGNSIQAETFLIDNPDEKRFYFTTFDELYLETYSIEDIVRGEIGYIKETLLGEYKMNINDISHTDKAPILMDARQMSGNYVAIAIGLNDDGTATRYYSSSKYTIPQETATEEYKAWLGTWSLKGANNQHFDIQLQPLDNNYMYAVRLWECGDHLESNIYKSFGGDLPFPAYYMKDGGIEFRSTSISDITVGNSSDLYVLGLYGNLTYNNEYGGLGVADIPLGRASKPVGNKASIEACYVKFDDGQNIKVESMQFQAYPYQGQQYMTFNTPMKFPIAMEKTEEYKEPTASAQTKTKSIKMNRILSK